MKTKAEFDYRVMGVKLGYFLSLTQEPKHPIVTWTLDYDRSSDLGTECVYCFGWWLCITSRTT